MQHPSELRWIDTLEQPCREWYPTVHELREPLVRGRQEPGTRSWGEEKAWERENAAGSSSKWQNESMEKIDLFNFRLRCERELNFWKKISGPGEKREGGRPLFGNDDKRGRKMKFKLASLDSDNSLVTWRRGRCRVKGWLSFPCPGRLESISWFLFLAEIREAFKVLDRDGNGFISKQEMGMAMRSLGYMPSEVELAIIMQRLDMDGESHEHPQM